MEYTNAQNKQTQIQSNLCHTYMEAPPSSFPRRFWSHPMSHTWSWTPRPTPLLTYHQIWFWSIRMIVVIWRQNRWTRTSSLKDAGPCRQSIVLIGSEWTKDHSAFNLSGRISTALKSNFFDLSLSCLWCGTVSVQLFPVSLDFQYQN